MKKLLWLDDFRNPFIGNWLTYSPIPEPFETTWVKSYNEFTEYITKNGLPDAICFDHDLAQQHMNYYFAHGGHANPPDPITAEFEERTGYDCAKWLIEYCMDNRLKLPKWSVQSANPCGSDNINGLLVSFTKKRRKSALLKTNALIHCALYI